MFLKSKTAATGIPKLEAGPQKWVVNTYLRVCLLKIFWESFWAAVFVADDDIGCLYMQK